MTKQNVAKEAERMERRRQVLALKIAGASYPEIAEALDIAVSTAHNDVQRALRDIPKDEADELRTIELSRLDRMQRELWAEAMKKEIPLVARLPLMDRILKLIDRRAKMLGLDSPTQVEVTGADIDIDKAMATLQAAMNGKTFNDEQLSEGDSDDTY